MFSDKSDNVASLSAPPSLSSQPHFQQLEQQPLELPETELDSCTEVDQRSEGSLGKIPHRGPWERVCNETSIPCPEEAVDHWPCRGQDGKRGDGDVYCDVVVAVLLTVEINVRLLDEELLIIINITY